MRRAARLISEVVSASTSDIKSRRPGQSGQFVGVRLQPVDLEALDRWIEAEGTDLSRPEAIRRLMRSALDQRA